MRAIHKVQLDKVRPAVLITRETALAYFAGITIAPITSTARGLASEVPVGVRNGLDHDSVVNCDDVATVPAALIGEFVGYLDENDEWALTTALHAAYGLYDRG